MIIYQALNAKSFKKVLPKERKSPQELPSYAAEWLPQRRQRRVLSNITFLWSRKNEDCLLALAWKMHQSGDIQQGRMFAKTYVFLLNFLPDGLVGDFAHLSGNRIMKYLLHFRSEIDPKTRFSIQGVANAIIAELKTWMEHGRDWREALKNANQHNT